MTSAEGAIRAAEAVLRANGGRTVLLRRAAPASAGDDAAQLGLETPQFQDVEIGPAVFRRDESTAVLMVSARAVTELLGTLAMGSAELLFVGAAGVVIDGVTYVVEKVVAEQCAGEPYCYAVTLRAPVVAV